MSIIFTLPVILTTTTYCHSERSEESVIANPPEAEKQSPEKKRLLRDLVPRNDFGAFGTSE
ncbi:MAG TPA: hypothetical protein ACFYD3_04595 [Candidatus Hypogeohydataceae bacterium YC41]